jgi:hypothetical protein
MSCSRLLCECNVNEINFLLDIKYELIQQNAKIQHFLQSRTSQQSDIVSITHNQEHATILYTVLGNIVNTNKGSLYNIDIELPNICKHRIVEDYIESGVDEPMIKIQYCEICEINLSEIAL